MSTLSIERIKTYTLEVFYQQQKNSFEHIDLLDIGKKLHVSTLVSTESGETGMRTGKIPDSFWLLSG